VSKFLIEHLHTECDTWVQWNTWCEASKWPGSDDDLLRIKTTLTLHCHGAANLAL